MKIIEINNNLKKLVSDEGKSLFENKEYKEDETPYLFKEAYLPVGLTMEDCLEKYNEILDTEIIIPEGNENTLVSTGISNIPNTEQAVIHH